MVACGSGGGCCCPSGCLAPREAGLNGMPRGTLPILPKAGGGLAPAVAVVAEPPMPKAAGKLPVVGGAIGGISSTTGALPGPVLIEAVRRLTARSLKSPSMRLPTPKAREGFPSTEISATPWPDVDCAPDLGEITPVSLKRVLSSDTGAAAATAAASFGVVPSKRATSPTAALESPTDTACAGMVCELTSKRSPQNMALPATRAQTMNAKKRGFIRPL